MGIIFLDIDGVLNNHERNEKTGYGTIDRDKVVLFNDVLERTDSTFVVSSAWRYLVHGESMSLEGFKHLLSSHWIDTTRFLDITEPDECSVEGKTTRGIQIQRWLSWHQHDRYVVLDDLDLGISGLHPFVQTDSSVGLTLSDCDAIVRKMEEQ